MSLTIANFLPLSAAQDPEKFKKGFDNNADEAISLRTMRLGSTVSHIAGIIVNLFKSVLFSIATALTFGQFNHLREETLSCYKATLVDIACIPVSLYGIIDPMKSIEFEGKMQNWVISAIDN